MRSCRPGWKLVYIGFMVVSSTGAGARTNRLRVAIIPFQHPYSELQRGLQAGLQRVPHFTLVPPAQVQPYLIARHPDPLIPINDALALEIGRLVQADAVLTGCYREADDQRVLEATMLDVSSGIPLYAYHVAGNLDALFLLRQMLRSLLTHQAVVLPYEVQQLEARGTSPLSAARSSPLELKDLGTCATQLENGNALYHQQRYADALVHYRLAHQLDPDNAMACYNLGMAQFQGRHVAEVATKLFG